MFGVSINCASKVAGSWYNGPISRASHQRERERERERDRDLYYHNLLVYYIVGIAGIGSWLLLSNFALAQMPQLNGCMKPIYMYLQVYRKSWHNQGQFCRNKVPVYVLHGGPVEVGNLTCFIVSFHANGHFLYYSKHVNVCEDNTMCGEFKTFRSWSERNLTFWQMVKCQFLSPNRGWTPFSIR